MIMWMPVFGDKQIKKALQHVIVSLFLETAGKQLAEKL